jgi:cell division initiation protein
MIDLTPLDVRSKRGDFKKLMRGYDPQEVDTFLEITAERLEALIRENMALKERAQTLQAQVTSQNDREQAVQAALVTAQELRADIREQAKKEAENVIREAETEGRRLIAEAEAEARTRLRGSERRLEQLTDSLQEVERRRKRFLKEFRQLLEREMDVVEVEEERTPLQERTIDLDLGTKSKKVEATPPTVEIHTIAPDAPVEVVPPADAPIDELAAAYERAREAAPDSPPPAPPAARRTDNLMLYLDTEDGEAGG